jgi:hypothetical protein
MIWQGDLRQVTLLVPSNIKIAARKMPAHLQAPSRCGKLKWNRLASFNSGRDLRKTPYFRNPSSPSKINLENGNLRPFGSMLWLIDKIMINIDHGRIVRERCATRESLG